MTANYRSDCKTIAEIAEMPRNTLEEQVERVTACFTLKPMEETTKLKYQWIKKRESLTGTIKQGNQHYLLPCVCAWCDSIQEEGSLHYPVLLAMLIAAECNDQGLQCKIAVGEVALNLCLKRESITIEDTLLGNVLFKGFNRHNKHLGEMEKYDHKTIHEYCALAWRIVDDVALKGERILSSDTTIYLRPNDIKREVLKWCDMKEGFYDFNKMYPRGSRGCFYFFSEL